MKKTFKILFATLSATSVAALAAVGLTACDNVKLSRLEVENAKTDFVVGDEFEYGDGFTVYAVYTDGTRTDVTDSVSIRFETGFDMDAEGDYQITIDFENKKYVYTVYVNGFDNILRNIELDTTNVRTQYELGDELSYDGLVIKTTHETAQGRPLYSTTTSTKGFTVKITDSKGKVVDESFAGLGTYTVTVSQDGVSANYTVSVDGINTSTVQSSINVGKYFATEVASGVQDVYGGMHGATMLYPETHFEYEFGDNYMHLSEESYTLKEKYHTPIQFDDYEIGSPKKETFNTIEDEALFCVTTHDGKIVNNDALQNSMMYGAPSQLWYRFTTEYGIENALANLYKAAKECTNKDLKETADEEKREYSFSFSGLVFRTSNSDFYDTTVKFKLGANYNIASAEILQTYYENNDAKKGDADYIPTFTTDENGFTTPGSKYSYQTKIVVSQTADERTAENPYNSDMFRFKSFDLTYKGRVLNDGDVIECAMSDHHINIDITNFMPSTATFSQDPMYISDGAYSGEKDSSTMLFTEGYMAYRNSAAPNTLYVQLSNGGTWQLVVKTKYVTKTITLKVTGVAPATMEAQIRNDATGVYYIGNSKTIALKGSVYFNGAVNKYANAAQTAELVSGNSADCKLETLTDDNGNTYFKFSSGVAGVYKVRVTSAANNLSCTFTFTVMDMPDFENILSGTYTTTDAEGNVYVLEFRPENEDNRIKGILTVTCTPTSTDGKLDTANAIKQTLSYEVNFEYVEIDLNAISGTNMGITLEVNTKGEFVLVDRYEKPYVLQKAD